MKVLQVNVVYPGGSTGKIVDDIHKSLIENGHESIVCYGRGEITTKQYAMKICTEFQGKMNNILSRFSGLVYGGCYWSTIKLIRILQKEKPDIVHLHCINGYFVNIYHLVEWLKDNHIPTVLTLHAEFMYTANCSHAFECEKWKTECGNCPRLKNATKSLCFDRTHESFNKMKRAFSGFERLCVVSVSPWVKQRAIQSSILCDFHHEVILDGVNTSVFTQKNTDDLRRTLGLKDEKILFHVSAHFSDEKNHPKGGWAIIELAKRLSDLPVKILVAAQTQTVSEKLPDNVICLGRIQDQELLAQYYSFADVSLIASRRETFSMPCAESLCCGTPVIGFQAGAPEMISLKEYSEFVEYGNLEELESAVRRMLERSDLNREEIASEACKCYSNELMTNQYLKIYGGLL